VKDSVPQFFKLLSAGLQLLVKAALERGIVSLHLAQLASEAIRGLGFLLETSVQIVVIYLQVCQLYRQLIALLEEENIYL